MEQMRKLGAGIISLLCLVAAAGCTTNRNIAPITTSPATLEMAVGTINDPGGQLGGGGGTAGTNLNVVTSFRNVLGNSAYQHPGTPTLTGPGGAIAFVQCASLFSYGQAPGCNSIVGVPPAYNPPSAVGGYATGFIITNAPPTSGAYSLSNATTVNGGVTTYTATASLPATPTVLPVDGGLVSFTTDNLGGGTFTINQPAGVTESLIVVMNAVSGEVASVETTGTTATITGTGAACPAGPAVPIPCGAFTVIVIGADYPLVEAGPPANTLPNPTLTGSGGSADLTLGGGASSE
jgi:hypothetical protein